MKRGILFCVEVIVKDGKVVEYFEDREDASNYVTIATAFTSNVRSSTWLFEKAGSQKTGSTV